MVACHWFVVGCTDDDSHFISSLTILRVVCIESPTPHGRPKEITFQAQYQFVNLCIKTVVTVVCAVGLFYPTGQTGRFIIQEDTAVGHRRFSVCILSRLYIYILLLSDRDVCPPIPRRYPHLFGRFQQFGHRSQRLLAVAQYCYVRLYILVYLRRVYIEMDNLCLRSVSGQLARNTVVETHAHRNQHIAFVGIDVRTQIAVHAQHALIQGMSRRQRRKPQQGTAGRHARLFDEGTQFVLRIAQLHALPYQHQRTFRRIYQIGSLPYGIRVGFGYRQVAAHVIYFGRDVLRLIHLRILGKVQHNRTGTPALCDIESTCHCPSHIFRTANLVAPLRDRLCNTYQVYFLKSVRAEKSRGNLPRNDDYRRAVYHGICNTRNGIGCSRAAGYQAYADLARHTCKALCGMGSSLFVANQDMVLFLPVVVQGIEYRHDAAARITENGLYSLMLQGAHQCFCACY